MPTLLLWLCAAAWSQANPDDATVGLEAEAPRLTAKVAIGPGVRGGRKVIITNEDPHDWTTCKVTLKGSAFSGYHHAVEVLPAGEQAKLVAGEFNNTIGDGFKAEGEIINVIIRCDEGWAMVWPGAKKKFR